MTATTRTDTDDLERLRFPVGRFAPLRAISAEQRNTFIDEIAALPAALRAALAHAAPGMLDKPYRPGGWTVRQVVHHLPDSHANAYIRFKLAVTEHEPTVKPYDEAAWAELPDGRGADVEGSLLLLEALHRRWHHFLRALQPDQFKRTFRHPQLGLLELDTNLQLYAWHCRHHLAHVRSVTG